MVFCEDDSGYTCAMTEMSQEERKKKNKIKIRIANEDVNDAISSQSTSFQGEISKRPKNISDLASLISRHFVTQ
jgi:hypothetical protein